MQISSWREWVSTVKMLKKAGVSSIYKGNIHKLNCINKNAEKTLAIFLYMWYLYGAVA